MLQQAASAMRAPDATTPLTGLRVIRRKPACDQLPKEVRVSILHRQFEHPTNSPPCCHRRCSRLWIRGGPLVGLPRQANAASLPAREIIEVDAVLVQQLVLS